MANYRLRVNVGRWQGAEDTFTVEDLDDSTLIEVAKKKIKQYAKANDKDGIGEALRMATQVLIWDDESRNHNLIAVYDIRIGGEKLTVLQ